MRVHIKCKQPAIQQRQQEQHRRREGDGGEARTRTTMTLALTQIYGNRRFVCDLECSHASVLVAYTCHIPKYKGNEGEKTEIRNKEMWYGAQEDCRPCRAMCEGDGGLRVEQGQGNRRRKGSRDSHDGRGHAE